MTISDEQLSAFLDRELSQDMMEEVRAALAESEALGDRLAQLLLMDEAVKAHARLIDDVPFPAPVTQLLLPENVVSLSAWQRARQWIAAPVALAASVALLIGIGTGFLRPDNGAGWEKITASLNSAPSGSEIRIDTDTVLLNRFTFRTPDHQYCRQFMVDDAEGRTENVACREAGQWQQVASVRTSAPQDDRLYAPASNSALLDSTLDDLMAGDALSLDDEALLIEQAWEINAPQ